MSDTSDDTCNNRGSYFGTDMWPMTHITESAYEQKHIQNAVNSIIFKSVLSSLPIVFNFLLYTVEFASFVTSRDSSPQGD